MVDSGRTHTLARVIWMFCVTGGGVADFCARLLRSSSAHGASVTGNVDLSRSLIHISPSPLPTQATQSHPYNESWMDWGPERHRT